MRTLVHEVVVCFNALCAKYKNNNEKMVHSLIECRKRISLYGKPCKQAKQALEYHFLKHKADVSDNLCKECGRPSCFSHLLLMLFKRVNIYRKK